MLSLFTKTNRGLVALAPTLRRTVYQEGSTARSKEFSKKEKAHEDQYARAHEQTQLAKLREEIEKKKKELALLEKEQEETQSSAKSS